MTVESRVSANASENLENLEDIFPRYYMHSDILMGSTIVSSVAGEFGGIEIILVTASFVITKFIFH